MEQANPPLDDLQIDNLPNRITLFRMALIPIIFLCLFLQTPSWPFPLDETWNVWLGWVAGWTFVGASITDAVDGYIARKRKIVTVFGSFLDPIADKFLVVSALILLEALGRINVLVVTILVLREFYMTSLRLLATNEGLKVPVNQLGKWKTAMQMIGTPMLMANETWWVFPFPLMGTICMYTACFLSLYSAAIYSIKVVKSLKLSRLKKSLRFKRKKEREQEQQAASGGAAAAMAAAAAGSATTAAAATTSALDTGMGAGEASEEFAQDLDEAKQDLDLSEEEEQHLGPEVEEIPVDLSMNEPMNISMDEEVEEEPHSEGEALESSEQELILQRARELEAEDEAAAAAAAGDDGLEEELEEGELEEGGPAANEDKGSKTDLK